MLNDLLDSDVKSSLCIIRKVKFLFSLVIAALLLSPLQWYIEKPLNYDFVFVLILAFGFGFGLELVLLCWDTIFAFLAEHVATNVVVYKVYSLLFPKTSFVLVFDDLERSLIPIEELWGYINYFVEQKNIKTIIIANTEEISNKHQGNEKQNTQSTQWSKIKEKVIDITLEVEADVNSAIDTILKQVENNTLKNKLLYSKNEISEIFKGFGDKNLRCLEQIIQYFERFYTDKLFEKDTEDNLFKQIVKIFLALSFEAKIGALSHRKSMIFDNNTDYTVKEAFEAKIRQYGIEHYILDSTIWDDIIFKYKIKQDDILKSLEKNYFRYQKEEPAWYQLLRFKFEEKEEFCNLVNEVQNDLKEISVGEEGEVKHIISLLMYFQEKKVININIDEYIGYAKKNLKKIYENLSSDRLQEIDNNIYYNYTEHEHTLGLGFYSKDNKNFKEFIKECKEIRKNVLQSKHQEQAKELLELLQNNLDAFCVKIKRDGIYYNSPILKYIEAKEFVEKFFQCKNADQKKIVEALINRYQWHNNQIILNEGKSWLPKIIQQLKEIEKQEDISFTKLRIENYIRWLERCLTNLK